MKSMKTVAVLLFEDFETLDVFGPVEVFGVLKKEYYVTFYSQKGGLVSNSHRVSVDSKPLAEIDSKPDIFLIPGGYGTREEVNNPELITIIKAVSESSNYVMTVCTGTALLARTGLLDGKNATSNKRAFEWVMGQGPEVIWIKKARWVVDGKYYTASGVSAGIDMTLGFLKDQHGVDYARDIAFKIEYTWHEDKANDPFGIL
jgi:putative intracellular protease/amidase